MLMLNVIEYHWGWSERCEQSNSSNSQHGSRTGHRCDTSHLIPQSAGSLSRRWRHLDTGPLRLGFHRVPIGCPYLVISCHVEPYWATPKVSARQQTDYRLGYSSIQQQDSILHVCAEGRNLGSGPCLAISGPILGVLDSTEMGHQAFGPYYNFDTRRSLQFPGCLQVVSCRSNTCKYDLTARMPQDLRTPRHLPGKKKCQNATNCLQLGQLHKASSSIQQRQAAWDEILMGQRVQNHRWTTHRHGKIQTTVDPMKNVAHPMERS